jgi:hypothetical protein
MFVNKNLFVSQYKIHKIKDNSNIIVKNERKKIIYSGEKWMKGIGNEKRKVKWKLWNFFAVQIKPRK